MVRPRKCEQASEQSVRPTVLVWRRRIHRRRSLAPDEPTGELFGRWKLAQRFSCLVLSPYGRRACVAVDSSGGLLGRGPQQAREG